MSFSGFISNFSNQSSGNDIISKPILSLPTDTYRLGQSGYVVLGGLLVQFGTGSNSGDGQKVTLPFTYAGGSYNNTGWHSPYIVLALPWSNNALYIGQKYNDGFTMYFTGTGNRFNWMTIGPVPANFTSTSASFSGYRSSFSNQSTTYDIISNTILSAPTGGGSPQGNYGRVRLGGLLLQFGTGYNVGNGTVTFPVSYPAGSGSSTGWYDDCIVFALPFSSNTSLGISNRTQTGFTIIGMGTSSIWYNWLAIGPAG